MIFISVLYPEGIRKKNITIEDKIRTEFYHGGYIRSEFSNEYEKTDERIKEIHNFLDMFPKESIKCFVDGSEIDYRKVLIF